MKRWVSIIALAIVGLMVLGMLTSIVFSLRASAEDVSDLQSELDDLAKKREALESDLNKIAEKKDTVMEEKGILDQQINGLSTEVDLLNDLVDDLSDQLDESQDRLDQAQDDLEENMLHAKERIRAMYELGNTSYAEIILNSKSLHDFISRVELVKQMAAYDQRVIDQLKEVKNTIETETAAIEKNKKEQESALDQLEENMDSLERKKERSEELIDTLDDMTESNRRQIEEIEAEEERLQQEIRSALSARNSGDFVGGQFLWPLPGYNTITSEFGYRVHPTTGVYKLHSGTDISGSGVYGSSILAANSGTVLRAEYNYAYGYYVLIDHGGGYSTLYGHCSSLNVSEGDTVSRGDVIAFVGSTGYSTGPHLHFEIIYDGEYQDPMDYFD